MIKLDLQTPKKCTIFNEEEAILELELIPSTVTNKFNIIANFIENVSKELGEDFDIWFTEILKEYKESESKRFILLAENVNRLKEFVNEYFNAKESDFSRFVDESKAKKSTIMFGADEIKLIILLSSYLKFYSIFSSSSNLKLDQKSHKKIYNLLAEEVLNSEIVHKIYNIIKTKTFRYNLTDRYMWDYIKMIQCKSIDAHIIEIFNFIMNSILVLCEEDRNPITYFVSVVDESITWFLRSVYKGSVIYEDSMSTEDVQGLNVNNLKAFSYNDTLGRLKGIAYKQIYDYIENQASQKFQETDKSITDFQNRVSTIKYVSPLAECLVYPVLSKITTIPYSHFKTISPEDSAVLCVYSQNLLRQVFDGQYKDLFSILNYYPDQMPPVSTTYKMKSVHEYINLQNKLKNFFGFDTKIMLSNILGFFVGRISRINFYNIFDGEKLLGVPLSRIENEMIYFYSYLFANKFEKEINKMRSLMYKDF